VSTVAGLPSLSELLAWPTEHLTEAADYWESIGDRCFGIAHQIWCDAMSIDWEGEAADALRIGTHTDMTITSAVDDQLHEAAKVARTGASDLYATRSRLRYAVEDAHTAGFNVGEDLSVTDRLTSKSAAQRAARQAQAQTFAGDIRQRATQLVALDQQVAANITAAIAGIRDAFPQNPNPGPPPGKPDIQAVDHHTVKDSPPPPNPSYPANEVIAEATDLDGNHVVLRRGYYDEATHEGFGWDKAYWRHHVINPNVFKDLISHARPRPQVKA
jgi:hypothetical protein